MAERPNIVFVFSDQQRYSAVGANGNPVVETPHLDAMANQGMVCDNFFSNHPLCSPYRAILLTGQYGWRNGVIDKTYYGAGFAKGMGRLHSLENVEIDDQTHWAPFLEPAPKHVFQCEEALNFSVVMWSNV